MQTVQVPNNSLYWYLNRVFFFFFSPPTFSFFLLGDLAMFCLLYLFGSQTGDDQPAALLMAAALVQIPSDAMATVLEVQVQLSLFPHLTGLSQRDMPQCPFHSLHQVSKMKLAKYFFLLLCLYPNKLQLKVYFFFYIYFRTVLLTPSAVYTLHSHYAPSTTNICSLL